MSLALRRLSRAVAALSALLLVLPPHTVRSQTAPKATGAWRHNAGSEIEWLRFVGPNLLVVSADLGLRGIDPADGTVRWQRADLGNISPLAFDASQQTAPLQGGTSGPALPGPPIIRLMEELPGGRLVAVLADSAGRRSWFDVVDLAQGTTVWSSTSLPVGEAHGFLPLPDSTTLLVYGMLIEPGRSRARWARVEAATGQVLWATDSLLLGAPAQFDPLGMAGSRGTINGNQPLIQLPDSSLLLYAAKDGLVRFDPGSGRVRWRAALSNDDGAPIGQGYAPMVVLGDTAFVPAGRAVDAVDLALGKRRWSTGNLSARPTELVWTPEGLLVRGQALALAGDEPSAFRPFAALVDTRTGVPRWKRDFDRRSGVTPALLDGDVALFGTDKGLVRLSLSAARDTILDPGKLPGRPAGGLERRPEGILLTAAQSLTLYSPELSRQYQKEFAAPTLSLGGRLLRIALSAAAIAGGAYYSGGYLAGTAFARYQYSTTAAAAEETYFVLKDYQGLGPTLARVRKADGAVSGILPLAGDKTPEYAIDRPTGTLVLKTAQTLTAYRW